MIITRSPLRISLGGGGTDLPSYYREHTGFVISAAIDKYVYITLHDTFAQEVIRRLSDKCGPENFHYIVGEPFPDFGEDNDEEDVA